VFSQHEAGPENVYPPKTGMLEATDSLFIDGDAPTLNTEDGKKLIPESLCLGSFGGYASPFMSEAL
jgi:hypothetical protein